MDFSKKKTLGLLLGSTMLMAVSCKKDEKETPAIPSEEELITSVILELTPTAGGQSIEWSFRDVDGPGGDDPIIESNQSLSAGTNYQLNVKFLNESEDPVEDITEEVAEEDEEHQVFFQANGADLSISYADSDENGHPIGLSNTLMANTASTGSLMVILRHEPDKGADGVSDGQIANAGGETDIEVSFDISIE